MNLLFLCSRNNLRSPTAERIFSEIDGIDVASAGVAPDAYYPVTSELVEWADTIFVMEPQHRTKLNNKFGKWLKSKKVVCLNIKDDYKYMDDKLVALLKQRVPLSVPTLQC